MREYKPLSRSAADFMGATHVAHECVMRKRLLQDSPNLAVESVTIDRVIRIA